MITWGSLTLGAPSCQSTGLPGLWRRSWDGRRLPSGLCKFRQIHSLSALLVWFLANLIPLAHYHKQTHWHRPHLHQKDSLETVSRSYAFRWKPDLHLHRNVRCWKCCGCCLAKGENLNLECFKLKAFVSHFMCIKPALWRCQNIVSPQASGAVCATAMGLQPSPKHSR